MLNDLLTNLKAFIAFIIVMVAMVAPSVVAYQVGLVNGRRQVARHIPEIRRLERINALAPRIKDDD